MKYLKKDSALANHFRALYENTPARTLYECYNKPSYTKKQIWNALCAECLMRRGQDIKVLSYNSNFFTVAFVYPNSDTGVCFIQVATPRHNYTFEW